MKRKRFSEEQIFRLLREAEAGVPVKELCRKHGMANASFCAWRSKYGGMEGSDAKRLKALEDASRRLKSIVVDRILSIHILEDVTGRKW